MKQTIGLRRHTGGFQRQAFIGKRQRFIYFTLRLSCPNFLLLFVASAAELFALHGVCKLGKGIIIRVESPLPPKPTPTSELPS